MTFCRHIFSYKNIIKIEKKFYIYPIASSSRRDRQAKSLVHESQPRVNDGAFYICVYRKGDCLMPGYRKYNPSETLFQSLIG